MEPNLQTPKLRFGGWYPCKDVGNKSAVFQIHRQPYRWENTAGREGWSVDETDCWVEQRVVIVAMRLNHLGGWVGQCGCCGHFALKHPHTTHQEFETHPSQALLFPTAQRDWGFTWNPIFRHPNSDLGGDTHVKMWVTKVQCFKFTGSPIGEKTLLGGRDGVLMKPIALIVYIVSYCCMFMKHHETSLLTHLDNMENSEKLMFSQRVWTGASITSEEIQHDVWPRHIIVDNEDQRLGNKQPLVLKRSQWL